MIIRDGKIIVYPSVRLIIKLYADGMELKHIHNLFGIYKRELHKILISNLGFNEYKEIKERRKNIINETNR